MFDFSQLEKTAPPKIRGLILQADKQCLRLQRPGKSRQQLILRHFSKDEFALYHKTDLDNSEPEFLMRGSLARLASLCGLTYR